MIFENRPWFQNTVQSGWKWSGRGGTKDIAKGITLRNDSRGTRVGKRQVPKKGGRGEDGGNGHDEQRVVVNEPTAMPEWSGTERFGYGYVQVRASTRWNYTGDCEDGRELGGHGAVGNDQKEDTIPQAREEKVSCDLTMRETRRGGGQRGEKEGEKVVRTGRRGR